VNRRWEPVPLPGDGPDGRGESGPSDRLETRDQTEEAAASGRFPEGDLVRDDSNPIEPEATAAAVPLDRDLPGVEITSPAEQHRDPGSHQPVEGLDRGVATEHLSDAGQGVRPERVDRTNERDAEG
jgi:hypothetical protein